MPPRLCCPNLPRAPLPILLMKLLPVSLPALCLVAGLCAAAPADDPALTAVLTRAHAASAFPGFCVATVKDDRVDYQQGFGWADRQAQRPYTAETVQPVGSVSKTLIGLALMRAVELKLLTLDEPVAPALDFKLVHPKFPKAAITLRQLATHTAGLIDSDAGYAAAYQLGHVLTHRGPGDTSLRDYLASYLAPGGKHYDRKNNFAADKPGAAYHYSNIGAALAALVIERRAGLPFGDFVDRELLQPLGMTGTAWFDKPALDARRATLYDAKDHPLPPYALLTYPDGGLRSSCADLGRYVLALLRAQGGAGAGLPLTAASVAEVFRPQFDSAKRPAGLGAKEKNVGLFFAMRADGSIGHTGSDPGVSAFVFFNPLRRTGKVFLTNVDLQENPVLARQFAAIWKLLDDE